MSPPANIIVKDQGVGRVLSFNDNNNNHNLHLKFKKCILIYLIILSYVSKFSDDNILLLL